MMRARMRSPRWTVSRCSAEYDGDPRSGVVRRLSRGLRPLALLIPLPLWLGLSWARSQPSSVSGGNALHNYLWGRSHERPYRTLDQTPPFAMPVGSTEK